MKKLLKAMSMLLVLAMVLSFAACAPGANTTQDPNASNPQADGGDVAAIAGEYLLDASDLGMPMKWYIKVNPDGKFVIATDRAYTALKGEGTVGSKDGIYMLVYADSTAEAPKTATFTMDGKNMLFSTNVPIGAASVSPNLEEGKYPTAKIIAHEDIQGSYLGTYEKAAMGSSVVYSYELILGNGLEYTFTSSFAMMGEAQTRTEIGSFAVEGTKITFTAKTVDGEAVEAAAVEGTIANQTISASFKLSNMASEAQAIEARLGIYAEQAGVYTGVYQNAMMGLDYIAKLELDAFGGYKYATYSAAAPETADYTEEGTYTYADGKFTFQSTAALEGTLANHVLSVKLPITTMVSNAVDLSLYAETVSGKFTGTGTTEAGQNYVAELELKGNAFVLSVTAEGAEVPVYVAKGTFDIYTVPMNVVVLNTTELIANGEPVAEIPAELKVTAPVADSGINAELPFDLDDTVLLGFQLAK